MAVDVSAMNAAVGAMEGRLRERLQELVEVESPSEDKAAVDRAGALVLEWAAELGATVKRHKQKGYGDVLELRFGRVQRGRGRVLLLGHLDTVWSMGTLKTMPYIDCGDGKLCGPGVVDMKAGVVMALEAVAALQQLGAERAVTLLLNSEEEIGSPISRAITEKLALGCSAVFVLEPAQGLAYKTARKGVAHFALRVEGVASHAGVDFGTGHSAVLEMARLIEVVSGFTDLKKGRTVNVGVVHGGTRSNVVAAECTAEVDVRVVTARDAAAVEKLFAKLKTADKACRLTVSGGFNRPPMERKPGTVKLYRQARALAAQMGFVLDEASTGGGSDGNFTAALGVPTLDGMGAVGGGAHAAHEHVVAAHLVQRTALLAAMIASAE
ncbi:MAG: M20 family metallopeptidase [Acidobacteriaceae bacterium]|nr:M20 family metallopeptidase [Acidobacteriaceae bacterium]